MFEQTVETSATPHVTAAECKGNLVVRGSEEQKITLYVQGGSKDAVLEQAGETFTLTARVGCLLTCPPGTTLTVGKVQGNLRVEGVEGPVVSDAVHGNVDLRDVGPTALEQVSGNLRARHVTGDLRVQTARGNVRIRQVEGSVALGQVGGNLTAEGLQGGLAAERVGGNVRLGLLVSPGATYRLSANGNLTAYLPVSASLRLSIRAGDRVRSSVPGLLLEEAEGETRGTLGAGEASLEAQVAGYVFLRPLEFGGGAMEGLPLEFMADLEGLGEQIEAHIAEAMAEMEARLEESLGRIDSEEIRRRAERATEQALRAAGRAAERARREAERAAERVRRETEREAERARLRVERAERRWQRASGRRSRPRPEPATDEERLRVLRMVEEGKITPEQAADLLAALEGR